MYPSKYTVPAGTEYTLPTPTNSGYIFLGWRDNNNVTHKAGDVVTVNSDMTFVAVWGNLPDVKPDEPEKPEVSDFPFYDVNVRDWYYDAVKYVYNKGLMDGVDTHEFAPNATLTRAMVWTIIAPRRGRRRPAEAAGTRRLRSGSSRRASPTARIRARPSPVRSSLPCSIVWPMSPP